MPYKHESSRNSDTAHADRRAVEATLVTDNLWRQIDRWVNEGGAVGDDTPLTAAPELVGSDRS